MPEVRHAAGVNVFLAQLHKQLDEHDRIVDRKASAVQPLPRPIAPHCGGSPATDRAVFPAAYRLKPASAYRADSALRLAVSRKLCAGTKLSHSYGLPSCSVPAVFANQAVAKPLNMPARALKLGGFA